MTQFELKPTNGRKSFGHKAIVKQLNDNTLILESYGTVVANFKNNVFEVTNEIKNLTPTTCNHIRAFQYFCGVKQQTKSEMIKNSINKLI